MIRTLVVVEVLFYRQGLAELLNRSEEVHVVASANSAESAERLARDEAPDVMLVDVGMADCAEAIRRVQRVPRPPKFVALAVNETPEVVLRWAEQGVAAYVPRNATVEELIRVLKGVAQEEVYCPPHVAAQLFQHVAALAAESRRPAPPGGLSPREQEVLELLALGLPNKTIATRLAISTATAKNHVHNILEKLRLHRRSEVACLLHGDEGRRSA